MLTGFARYLERQCLLVRDGENTYLTAEGMNADNETPMNQLLGSSITYRIAMGPQQGRKVFTLQTLPNCGGEQLTSMVGKVAGFSLHAGVAARAFARSRGRTTNRVGSFGRVPKIGKHVDAAGFDLRRLRIFVLVDHVLFQTLRSGPRN